MSEIHREIIGMAVSKVPKEDLGRSSNWLLGDLERVSIRPEFGKDYDEDTVGKEYKLLLREGEDLDLFNGDYSRAYDELVGWAKQHKDERKPIDLKNPKSREMFAKAMVGLKLLPAIIEESGQIVSDPSQLGYWDRQKYFDRIAKEMKEALGIEEDVNSDYLERLLGELSVINPREMANLSNLTGEQYDGTFKNNFTDEQLVFLDAFGTDEESGKDMSTYQALMGLKDLSKMNMEHFMKLVGQVNPNELFFLMKMPFRVRDVDGLEIRISISEVMEFMMTPNGRQFFHMTEHEMAKGGVSEYIKFLGEKYPKAIEGLSITSNFKVIDSKTGEKRVAGVLDRGKNDIRPDDDEVNVTLATNSTWLGMVKLARGAANLLTNRGEIYRHGQVMRLSPDLQKGADAYSYYLDAYKQFPADTRLKLPRFRGMWEYMGNNSNYFGFFGEYKTERPDPLNPYHPRENSKRNQGIEIAKDFKSNDERCLSQIELLTMFFGFEQDPAGYSHEIAIQELVSAATGVYYDEVGKAHDRKAMSTTEQIEYAWKLRDGLVAELDNQTYVDDEKLKTLQDRRLMYPLPPSLVLKRLKSAPPHVVERLDHWDFKRRVEQYVEVGKGNYRGVAGAIKLAEAMGSGYFTYPRWGDVQKNAPIKHAGYEESMKQIYKNIVTMDVGSTQAKSGEIEEEMEESLAYGHVDLEERTVKIIDKAWNSLKGIQAIPSLRAASWKEFSEAYIEAVSMSGLLVGQRGAWWLYRRGVHQAKYMAGFATAVPYLSGTMVSRKVNGDPVHNPVVMGESLGRYNKFFELKDVSDEALAVLGCYFEEKDVLEDQKIGELIDIRDDKRVKVKDKEGRTVQKKVRKRTDIIDPTRAGGVHPIAMVKKNGEIVVDPRRINVSKELGHMRQIPKNQEKTEEIIREALFEVIVDLEIDVPAAKLYYDFDSPNH